MSLGQNWYEGILERIVIFSESHIDFALIIWTIFWYPFWLLLVKIFILCVKCLMQGHQGPLKICSFPPPEPTHPCIHPAITHRSTHPPTHLPTYSRTFISLWSGNFSLIPKGRKPFASFLPCMSAVTLHGPSGLQPFPSCIFCPRGSLTRLSTLQFPRLQSQVNMCFSGLF